MKRAALSVFLSFHVVALCVDAIPAQRGASLLGNVLQPIKGLTQPYIDMTGLHQRWDMFARPPRNRLFAHFRFYVRRDTSAQDPTAGFTVYRHLVYPAHREDRVRVFRSYFDSFRDKAFSNALDAHVRERERHEKPRAMQPLARYFARSFAERDLDARGTIARVELWVGSAATPPPFTRTPFPALLDVLEPYYTNRHRTTQWQPPFPRLGAAEDEGVIRWVLQYAE